MKKTIDVTINDLTKVKSELKDILEGDGFVKIPFLRCYIHPTGSMLSYNIKNEDPTLSPEDFFTTGRDRAILIRGSLLGPEVPVPQYLRVSVRTTEDYEVDQNARKLGDLTRLETLEALLKTLEIYGRTSWG